jgi:DNA-directed RNA polymerase subunit RPC12/RpoP
VIELAEVFRRHGLPYLEKHGESMLPSHRRALDDIMRCRTPAMGGHVYQCRRCGREHYAYHSCRSRACPKCHRRDVERWLEKRRGELLPAAYFHVVFTVPHSLRELIRSNQKALHTVLMKAAATCLIDLARDPKHLGATLGVLAVLHTWGRTMAYHPHVHCLVTAGGVSLGGEHWVPARKDYLVPVRVLSRLFRGRFMAMAARGLPEVKWPKTVWDKDWVVYCKPAMRGPGRLLEYLGRYVHRVALSNGRIVQLTDGHVRFRYKPVDGKRWRIMTLEAEEFIRRFLQHVPPKGAHKVRYYGLWAPSNRRLLRRVQLLLGPVDTPDCGQTQTLSREGVADAPKAPAVAHRCPYCGSPRLVHLLSLPKMPRGPP